MPQIGPVSRRVLIDNLRRVGFRGPYPGGRHEFMMGRGVRLILPNPHRGGVSAPFLARILRQARVTRNEWEAL